MADFRSLHDRALNRGSSSEPSYDSCSFDGLLLQEIQSDKMGNCYCHGDLICPGSQHDVFCDTMDP